MDTTARIKESIMPSGVPFTVRNLKGKDQRILSKIKDENNISPFNEMLAGATLKLGIWEGEAEITTKKIESMLSNDRKFMLITLRQHTLDYQKEFNFNYEWPLRKGSKEKEVQPYSVNFSHENFPVRPYRWMREAIEKLNSDGDKTIYDGHLVCFPKLYDSYQTMLEANSDVEDTFPNTTTKFKYHLLDGIVEKNFAHINRDLFHANTSLEMRNPKYFSLDENDNGKGKWVDFDIDDADLIWVEFLRKHFMEQEGKVDTVLTIQHQSNPTREQRVDLVGLPAFFFPSQAI